MRETILDVIDKLDAADSALAAAVLQAQRLEQGAHLIEGLKQCAAHLAEWREQIYRTAILLRILER